MNKIADFRNRFFEERGKSRISRIALCTMGIILLWAIIDAVDGRIEWSIQYLWIRICLGMAIEMILPWGKSPVVTQRQIHYYLVDSREEIEE